MRQQQAEIIQALKVAPSIDSDDEIERSLTFITDYLKRYPFLKTLVLGISGGQDSTLAGKLCQMAIKQIRQTTQDQAYQFIAVTLPYGQQSDAQDVKDALAFIQPDQVLDVNIKGPVDQQVTALAEAGLELSDFNKGNIKARQRMVVQYAIAGQCSGVVVGTDHAAEAVTGFYTKFGDGASDIVPLWRLNKRQGKQLLKALNCPPHLYDKVPTADLEDDRPQLPDEEALGVSYQAIDDYLEGQDVSDQDAQTIENWYQKSQHKRHLPINLYDTWWRE
ncbi:MULTISPECIES: ammonia-dependent NAD(+) synthetase [Aerococcus]|uniref:ammonia-dependent NAD(+) synthetase n=1 Tax=Aerococcus urinae (strain CCUG 59500 / ACS-120-V-Col10a) TaxID=2976812 RepID=UPI000200F085|nr:ammonia-dependent NAD(+) synthetase [Aerococcus sp. Group 1]AEA00211.1 NAD+ synthase [Aerococcus sp. Group 1]MCY3030683.1 ammonia-dependent NAD(+) synthetase [Aerococcus sp. Group 1]MCY3054314.1 ammonia-dependent NAD(+) synthetase [Aerococcus sp. Group 1]MCY3056044.1 ammonia-dependent NAD(+) synthetase [Aerococcus sp. Group 1]MCY3062014.1 ammonia-dependent NAD(+) synthetase [Aerococcus sp. Group 1]